MRRQIVIGNWKLHGSQRFVTDLVRSLAAGWTGVHQAEVVICPAFVHVELAYRALSHSNIGLGAQDVSHFAEGAFTGDVSAEMLHDVGCHYVIVGHSERRCYHQESDFEIAKKFQAAQNARLVPILCIGESAQAREEGSTLAVVDRQIAAVADVCGLDNLARAVIAYEPIWAVGTGKTATPEQVQEVHQFIRTKLGSAGLLTRIVYGGSVKPLNATTLFSMPDIDGALIGGSALIAQEFLEICRAAE
jgi:triosephosphate isomerase (TIM)